MNHPPVGKNPGQLRILVAPLDWGLGHATRCIPVIYELLEQQAEVWLAGEGAQEILLKKEFPNLPFLHLRGYRVKYGKTGFGLLTTIFQQLPQILRSIRDEHDWLKQAVNEHHFDAVVSDNRYGMYHKDIPSVFISHQLKIKSPFGKWTETILQKRNYRFINRFTECWVPDKQEDKGLAGELSHPVNMPAIPVSYLGILSRFEKTGIDEKKKHLLVSLSGPEPQRTLLENKIIHAIGKYNGTAVIARGLPGETRLIPSTNDIKLFNHLPAEELSREMEKADYVISRSGYSTVMDIVKLGKKSILIPTPGQTEQEYLAHYLAQKKIAFCVKQSIFSLPEALQNASEFDYGIRDFLNTSKLSSAISTLLLKLSN